MEQQEAKTELELVTTKEQVERVAHLARIIWTEHYTSILGTEQVEYMLEQVQSAPVIWKTVKNKIFTYYLIRWDQQDAGYVALDQQNGKLFLSKLYLLDGFRGHHIATTVFTFLDQICEEEDLSSIWLTCNIQNTNAIDVYQHFGFEIINKQAADIGEGYILDDYILEKKIK